MFRSISSDIKEVGKAGIKVAWNTFKQEGKQAETVYRPGRLVTNVGLHKQGYASTKVVSKVSGSVSNGIVGQLKTEIPGRHLSEPLFVSTRTFHSSKAMFGNNDRGTLLENSDTNSVSSKKGDRRVDTSELRDELTREFFGVTNSDIPMGQLPPSSEKAEKYMGIAGKALERESTTLARQLETRLKVIEMKYVKPTEEVILSGVTEIADGMKAHGVLSGPVAMFDESEENLVVADGNHRWTVMNASMKKGVFQLADSETKIEMRPYVVSRFAFSSELQDGNLVPLQDGEDRGSIYITDRETGKVYVPNPDLLEGKSEVEKIHRVRDLFPIAESRLNQTSLKATSVDRFVITFDYDSIPGPNLPAKTFTVVPQMPRIFISGGLKALTPDEYGVSPIMSSNAYSVDQTFLASNGLTVGGRPFDEGVVILAPNLDDATNTLVSIIKEEAKTSEQGGRSLSPTQSNSSLVRTGGVLSSLNQAPNMPIRYMSSSVRTEAMPLLNNRPVIAVFDKVDSDALQMLKDKGYDVKQMKTGDKVPEDTAAILVRSSKIDDTTLEHVKHPEFTIILRLGSGLDNVSVSRGIVGNTPGANGLSVAELGFALLFQMVRNTEGVREELTNFMEQDKLAPGPEGNKQLKLHYEGKKSERTGSVLSDKRLFVVGTGGVGSQAIRLGQRLGMKVTAVLRENPDEKTLMAKSKDLSSKVHDIEALDMIGLNELSTTMKPKDTVMLCFNGEVNAANLPDDIQIINMGRQSTLVVSDPAEKPNQRIATDEPTVELLRDSRLKAVTMHQGASTKEAAQTAAAWGIEKLEFLLSGRVPKGIEFRGTSEDDYLTLFSERTNTAFSSFNVIHDYSADQLAKQMISVLVNPMHVPAGPVIATPGGEAALNESQHLAFVSHRSKEVMALHDEVVDLGRAFLKLDDDQVFIPNGVSASAQFVASLASVTTSREDVVQVIDSGQWSKKAKVAASKIFENIRFIKYEDMDTIDRNLPVHFTLGETISGCILEPPKGCKKLVVDASTGLGATELPSDAVYIYGGNQKAWGLAEEAWVVARPAALNPEPDFIPPHMTFKDQLNLGRTFNALNLVVMKGTLQYLEKNHGDYSSWQQFRREASEPLFNAIDSTLNFALVHPRRAFSESGRWASPINVVFKYNPDASLPFSLVKTAMVKAFKGSAQHKSGGDREFRITTMHQHPERLEKAGEAIIAADTFINRHAESVISGKNQDAT